MLVRLAYIIDSADRRRLEEAGIELATHEFSFTDVGILLIRSSAAQRFGIGGRSTFQRPVTSRDY